MQNSQKKAVRYEFTEEMVNNLFTLLDRVEIKGFKELQVMNNILDTLNSPILEDNKDHK
ncbi:hypothetical protein [Clostridium sp. Marseille-QA1073]